MSLTKPDKDVETYSGIRLRKRYMKTTDLDNKLATLDYIACNHLSSRIKPSIYVEIKKPKDWATIGIVERSIKTDNAMLVLRLTDLRNCYIDLFLLGKANERYKDLVKVGTVLGVTKPTVLSSEDAVGLQVNHLQQIWHIGESLDMGRCEAYIQPPKRCSATIDRRSGVFCDLHITSICNLSKNGRMELASGDSGIDIRWASTVQSKEGQTHYKDVSGSLYSKIKKKEHIYTIKDIRMTSDGKQVNKKPVIDKQKIANEKESWTKFLKGHNDPGAMNIRKIIGIQDDQPSTALSKEALLKVHNTTILDVKEKASKKRSIDQILELEQRRKNKNKKQDDKQVYIDL
ncbi:uncharacterized protein BX664DRAFT_326806 [Halteromyces radiatus]|uniref:uncharacterized protein n=1 Tax=Halteromyces radiatus TaxID=101107 RepID=UPI0022209424|nr:uncharacterized protein BX664DRAFT_326806 [Halteromyces radiatus]KAI8097614.1 hypothetical protein BX664DRAFT_326806 [Halteromyces radiatus]